MTSEATKMAVAGNMHIDARVIEVACIKYDVKFDPKRPLRRFGGHHGLKGCLNNCFWQTTIDTTIIEVLSMHHMLICYCPARRRFYRAIAL